MAVKFGDQSQRVHHRVAQEQIPPQPFVNGGDSDLQPDGRYHQALMIRKADAEQEKREIQIFPPLRLIHPAHQQHQNPHQ